MRCKERDTHSGSKVRDRLDNADARDQGEVVTEKE